MYDSHEEILDFAVKNLSTTAKQTADFWQQNINSAQVESELLGQVPEVNSAEYRQLGEMLCEVLKNNQMQPGLPCDDFMEVFYFLAKECFDLDCWQKEFGDKKPLLEPFYYSADHLYEIDLVALCLYIKGENSEFAAGHYAKAAEIIIRYLYVVLTHLGFTRWGAMFSCAFAPGYQHLLESSSLVENQPKSR